VGRKKNVAAAPNAFGVSLKNKNKEENMVKRIILIIAIAMIAFSGVAMAADNATVNVSANVVGTCKFDTKVGTLPFGDLDPAVGGNMNNLAATQPTFWCTKGSSYTITDDDGLHKSGTTHRMVGPSPTDLIPYTFTYTASGTGQGKSTLTTMNIAGQILGADYINATAGGYSDTVTLSINP
jgi:spore coat protein U-like protein